MGNYDKSFPNALLVSDKSHARFPYEEISSCDSQLDQLYEQMK